jgi:hypothetical protein
MFSTLKEKSIENQENIAHFISKFYPGLYNNITVYIKQYKDLFNITVRMPIIITILSLLILIALINNISHTCHGVKYVICFFLNENIKRMLLNKTKQKCNIFCDMVFVILLDVRLLSKRNTFDTISSFFLDSMPILNCPQPYCSFYSILYLLKKCARLLRKYTFIACVK